MSMVGLFHVPMWLLLNLNKLAGQFYDVLHLFSLTGPPTEKHYLLMNGDLVDRGSWSIEVILLAFAYKCVLRLIRPLTANQLTIVGLYPKYMYINRGNHEAKDMNRTYGFEGEAKHKHGEQSYKASPARLTKSLSHDSKNILPALCPCFHHLWVELIIKVSPRLMEAWLVPLSTLVSATKPPQYKGDTILSPQGLKRFFVVHGGLFSKDDVTLDDVRQIDRVGRQPGQEGIMCKSIPSVFLRPNQLI